MQFVRDSFADLLDQNTPFGRLALTHVLSTAGDTMVTISLAGSLFFSISPDAAKSRVILYLLLTAAPFGVVAPLLGPVIDRSRGARRALVITSTSLRAVVCIIMAGDVKSLLLFPEAFTMLVLSKIYLVTKGALVPILSSRQPIPPGGVAAPSDAVSSEGTVPVVSAAGEKQAAPEQTELSVLNARLGLLASLAGFVAALPAILILKLGGAGWVLRVDILVFAAATVAGARLPIERLTRSGRRPSSDPTPQAGAQAMAQGSQGSDWGESDGPPEPLTPLE